MLIVESLEATASYLASGATSIWTDEVRDLANMTAPPQPQFQEEENITTYLERMQLYVFQRK